MAGEIPGPLDPQLQAIQLALTEVPNLFEIYRADLERLPKMEISPYPVADGADWKATGVEETKVGEIESSRGFFYVRGAKVTREARPDLNKPGLEWTQPYIAQSSDFIEVQTLEGMKKFNGFVSIISDATGRVLLTLENELLADKPKHGLYRTPLQTSAAKLRQVREGKAQYDPVLSMLLTSASGSQADLFAMFSEGKLKLKELPLADPNRIATFNGTWNMMVDDPKVIQELERIGHFFTPEQINALINAGLVNGHTVNAIAANRGIR